MLYTDIIISAEMFVLKAHVPHKIKIADQCKPVLTALKTGSEEKVGVFMMTAGAIKIKRCLTQCIDYLTLSLRGLSAALLAPHVGRVRPVGSISSTSRATAWQRQGKTSQEAGRDRLCVVVASTVFSGFIVCICRYL